MSTETGWTKGIPAHSGWYFMRTEGEEIAIHGMVVWVGYNASGVRHEGQFFYANDKWLERREFLGPLQRTDFEQLAALRKAAKDADDALQLIQGFDFALDSSAHGQEIRRRAIDAIAALREALGDK